MNPLNDLGYKPDDLTVQVTELLVATADASDELVDQSVSQVLRLLRDRMKMDVVFVSEFTDGQRVMRQVAAGDPPVVKPGDAAPLEASWCQRVVDGRLPRFIADARALSASAALLKDVPFPIGTHISTPIVLQSGDIYGTLCCFSFHAQGKPDPEDLKKLEFTARLAAQKLDQRRVVRKAPESVPDWQLRPK
ncbi:MAG: GAF domain-containing protein [Hydrogenophaga sp.]|nr:GAF domain-containing protein [Hydrogenophaga sp.]